MKTPLSPLAHVRVVSLILVFLHLQNLAPARAAEPPSPTITWTGTASALWNNTNNWSPTRLPLTNDHVAITGTTNFTVTLNVSASIASLALGADSGSVTQRLALNTSTGLTLATNSLVRARGELVLPNGDGHFLDGAGLLEVRGLLDWTGGRLSGRTTVSVGGRALLRGGNYMRLASGNGAAPAVFTNAGTVIWSGGQRVLAYDNSQIHNLGRWEVTADGQAHDHCCSGTGATFRNSGTLVKTAGTGTTTMESFNFINEGTVSADVGLLQFPGNVSSEWRAGGRIAGAAACSSATAPRRSPVRRR